MSQAAPFAARRDDPVAHSHALAGFLAGAVIGFVAATEAAAVVGAVVGAVAVEVGTAGLATPLVVGVAATALEFGVGGYVGAKLMGAAEKMGEALGAHSLGPASGRISQGAPNVRINGRPAARALDAQTCDAGQLAQGSKRVRINGRPASRVGDKTTCGGQVLAGSPNVRIGGPPDTRAGIQPEVPEWVRWATLAAALLPALGEAAAGLGVALAEVEATGLTRAAQTGAKALGRAMEERGGGAKAAFDPFAGEPAVPPGGRSEISDFTAKRPGGVDMNNLSPADSAAADAMKGGGWDLRMQKQVLNSGRDFGVRQGGQGDPMYKFSSAGRDEAAADPSAYYVDQTSFDRLKAAHYDATADSWNGKGVKNDLALPCYNTADALWRGRLAFDQPLATSTINPAVETVTLTNADGSQAAVFARSMAGGGQQVTPANGGVDGLAPWSPRSSP